MAAAHGSKTLRSWDIAMLPSYVTFSQICLIHLKWKKYVWMYGKIIKNHQQKTPGTLVDTKQKNPRNRRNTKCHVEVGADASLTINQIQVNLSTAQLTKRRQVPFAFLPGSIEQNGSWNQDPQPSDATTSWVRWEPILGSPIKPIFPVKHPAKQ